MWFLVEGCEPPHLLLSFRGDSVLFQCMKNFTNLFEALDSLVGGVSGIVDVLKQTTQVA